MPRDEKAYHLRFLAYMERIINNPNYRGLPIEKKKDGTYSWVATGKSKIGQQRQAWCDSKAQELGIPLVPGHSAEVMRTIHPTKWKVCQTCGREMSIYYYYPNARFVQALNKRYGTEYTECDHIGEIWDELIESGESQQDLAKFLINKGGLDLDAENAGKDEIIESLELVCRRGTKKLLGPGAMSNFPDRFDGFHSYNRCCRASQDKGRFKENMKGYTKDRRAYEYWSDGNIHAANQYMGSSRFEGISADHVGPISLGFIHDPRYLQPMEGSDNSSKRDRLLCEDVDQIIAIFERTGVYPMSWYSSLIWEYIKDNYQGNRDKVATVYRDALKQNMANFMFVLITVLEQCPLYGENILTKAFLEPHMDCFRYSYSFNDDGEIVDKQPRHYTGRNQDELGRYIRIAIEAVYDYNDKDNRNVRNNLTSAEKQTLSEICDLINEQCDAEVAKEKIVLLMEEIQNRLISHLKSIKYTLKKT